MKVNEILEKACKSNKRVFEALEKVMEGVKQEEMEFFG